MLVTSTSSGPCSRCFGCGVLHVARPAVGRRSRDPPSCLRGDDRLRAWRGPVRGTEGNAASSHHRLDLGLPDGGRSGQFVLDPPDPAGRSVEPDPSAVDLYAGDASARRVEGTPSPGCRSSPHHDFHFFRGACDRWAVHAAAGADHAQRRVWSVIALKKRGPARGVFVAKPAPPERLQRLLPWPARRGIAGLVSLWKNEGKIRLRGAVRGGLGTVDTLYDSDQELTGFPPLSDTEDTKPGEPPAPSDIRPVSILDEMKRSYLDYAMSVIVARALPDARDGLKPVHRRILYAMYENGFEWNKSYNKSARTVGDVIGKYHPHGDQSVYDALVRLAQDFSMRVPLIDGQGNFGSVDGDTAAAMRYTESRLTKIAQSLIDDIDKDTVDFQANYDSRDREPTVLPAKFPNLLVNGAGGIAVGMATNIPPHNLGEVIDACVALIDNPALTIDELINIIPGPDFPTGGIILGRQGIRSAYHLGRGSIMMRGKVEFETLRGEREAIVISEIPYQVNKAHLVERIGELVRDKKLEGISALRDESDRDGYRVVIEMRRDAVPDVVLNQLYRFTPLQSTFGANIVALDGGRPLVMNLKDLLVSFIVFREEVISRRTKFLLGKARDRAHVLVGLAIAVANIDEMIRLIRASRDANEAREALMGRDWPAREV